MVNVPASGQDGLVVEDAVVRFGALTALDGVSLAVAPGEVVAVLGPSGCGKSTLLRAIAGLEAMDAGRVRWNGADLGRMAAHERGFGLMFQDHALFPHRTVAENVAFGLRMQHVGRAGRAARTDDMLRLVGLAGYGSRKIDTLSGGEAQRVALARALAPSPRLLMLDEPLGSLDRALRERLAGDLRELLRTLDQAAIHVTHDQDEAFAVADRVVVMRAGRVARDGPAAQVWRDPQDEWVARFLGHENVLDARDAAALGVCCRHDGEKIVLPESAIEIGIAEHGVAAAVDDIRFRGAASRVVLRTCDGGVTLVVHTSRPLAVGDVVWISVDRRQAAPVVSS
jgi:thiamine transport system ATP-binding protein